MSEAVRDEIKTRLIEAAVPVTQVDDLATKIERTPDLYGEELKRRLKELGASPAAAMEIVETVPRPVSTPAVSAVRTLVGASVVASVLLVPLKIANPALASIAIVAATSMLSGLGSWSRDMVDAEVHGWRRWVANTFRWIG